MKAIQFASLSIVTLFTTHGVAVNTAGLQAQPTAMLQLDPLSLDFSQTASASHDAQSYAQTGPSTVGEWIELNVGYNPEPRYGHTADLYEPASADMVENLKQNLRPADINAPETDGPTDSMFMIVFGGKNAQHDVMFNDIYFLAIPSFEWYMPRASVYNVDHNGPQARLGHASAIYGDKLVIFGGHVVDQTISNELYVLDLQTMQWTNEGPQASVQPLAYMANTVILETMKMALFGGLTQDVNGHFKTTNEVLFFDLNSHQWQKPGKVFAETVEDVPAERMGAEIVFYGDKLWIYAGAQPITNDNPVEQTFSDFFSFDLISGLWKKETGFSGMNGDDGTILGKAVRLYNTDAAVFFGGCDANKKECSFDQGRQILFEQPNANFAVGREEGEGFEGREGHSLIQLGDSIISFGGCQFGKTCFSELLIQKPRILGNMNAFDCKNGGHLSQMNIDGAIHQFCRCQDLPNGNDKWWTGPQCQYTAEVSPNELGQGAVGADTFYTITQTNVEHGEIGSTALASIGQAQVYENDGTCGENACSGAGICFQETCYCKRFYSGDDCEIDTAHPGLPAKTTMTFYSVALGLGFTMGAFLSKIYNSNDRRLLK